MQTSMFDGNKKFKIDKPIMLSELFCGVGAFSKAFQRLNIPFEYNLACDFDKYAVCSFNAIHGNNFSTSDITKLNGKHIDVDTDKYNHFLSYSFPCTDLSKAGKQKGMDKDSCTRSGLLWEVERLLIECNQSKLPTVLIMENVPDVIGQKNIHNFAKWIEFLETKGYKNYWQNLNSRHYGIAQNRDRCFMISILGDYYYDFPNPIKLEKRLKDYLESDVDEKYYIDDVKLNTILNSNFAQQKAQLQQKDVCDTILSRDYKDPKCVVVGMLDIPGRQEHACHVHSIYGISPTCMTCGGGGLEPKILEPINSADGFMVNQSDSFNAGALKDCARTLQALNPNGAVIINNYRIRKLTPLECWRLMDYDDTDFYKAQKALNDTFNKGKDRSNSQLYKQAGNGIVVNVLVSIFKEML